MFHPLPVPVGADAQRRNEERSFNEPRTSADSAALDHYLSELALGERLEFDGVCVADDQSPRAAIASPNQVAAMLLRSTARAKIMALESLAVSQHPLRLADEWARLDVASNGRLVCGMSLGKTSDYFLFGANPTYAMAQFIEALELMTRSWSACGGDFNGRFWQVRNLRARPSPAQRPHPPLWALDAGFPELIELAGRRGWTLINGPFAPFSQSKRTFAALREHALAAGTQAHVALCVPVYVAESDAAARQQYQSHLWNFIERLAKEPPPGLPGWPEQPHAGGLPSTTSSWLGACKTWQDIEEGNFAVVGSPASVRERLLALTSEVRARHVLPIFRMETLPHALIESSLRLFASEIRPCFADAGRGSEQ